MEQTKAHTKSIGELARSYGITVKTLRKWFIRAGIDCSKKIRILTPAKVAEVYEKIGEP